MEIIKFKPILPKLRPGLVVTTWYITSAKASVAATK